MTAKLHSNNLQSLPLALAGEGIGSCDVKHPDRALPSMRVDEPPMQQITVLR